MGAEQDGRSKSVGAGVAPEHAVLNIWMYEVIWGSTTLYARAQLC